MQATKSVFPGSIMVFAGIIALSCASAPAHARGLVQRKAEPNVTAYIRTWPLDSDGETYWTADMIHGEYLSEIIIAFALIDQNDKSSIYISDGDPAKLWTELASLKARLPHLKVKLSVGGWGAEFSDTAADPDTRAAFIANVCNWLKTHDLDGVDIDWEYPVGPEWGQEIKSRPEDRENFIALLSELRTALDAQGAHLGKRYGLSACIPASAWYVTQNDVLAIAAMVDNLKLMAYDYYGAWSSTTGHLANLRNNPADPAWGGWSTEQAVNVYLNAGVPPEKIVLGLSFYGRAWAGVNHGETNGLFQNYTSAVSDAFSWLQIKKLIEEDSTYTRYWDNSAQAPYLYNGDIFITYTDPQAIALIAAYAKEKGLGGVMVWEYAYDIQGDLFKVLNEHVEK
ncbi:MAG: glycoside hydrolase family 18 protein [Treponema sp.]|jgi:chitinase|nr:glycoside hydrolase family 18 protein [Treponema sp.]